MGYLRKSIESTKTMPGAAQGMVGRADQLAGQVQQMQVAQRAQAVQMQASMQDPTVAPGEPRLAPIGGVPIDRAPRTTIWIDKADPQG